MVVSKFLILMAVIYGSLLLGYSYRRRTKQDTLVISRIMMRWLLIAVEPPIIMHAFWTLDLGQGQLLFLVPGIGLLVSLSAMAVAWGYSRLSRQPPKSQGSMMVCGLHSNTGITLGAFVCYLFLGGTGLSYAMLYCVYIMPLFTTVGIAVARYYGTGTNNWRDFVRGALSDPVTLVPNTVILLGLILNVMDVEMPELYDNSVGPAILVTVALYAIAIGMTIRFTRIKTFLRECLATAGIKFIWSPLVAWSACMVLGVEYMGDGLPFSVILIQAAMPVGTVSLTLTRLFNLDTDLSNSVWITTTLAIIPLLPVLQWIAGI